MKLSLRWKMLLLIFLLTAVPIFALGINDYRASVDRLGDNVREAARSTLAGSADVADLFLKSVEEAVTMVVNNSNVQNSTSTFGASNRMLELFATYESSHEDILNVFMGTKFKAFFVEPQIELPLGFDPTEQPWYPAAIEKNGLIWTAPYVDMGTGLLKVSAAMPVYKPGATEEEGVAGVDVSLESLARSIAAKSVGQEGYLVLLDDTGQILAHPDPTKMGAMFDLPELLQSFAASPSGELDYTEAGDERFAAFTTVPRTGWKLAALISYDEARVHARAQLLRTLSLGALFSAIAMGIGVIFSNRLLISPVSRLVKGAEEIAKGNFRTELRVRSGDELGLLAEAFLSLQRDLGRLIGEVKVASDTTAQLSHNVFGSSQEISSSTEEMAATTNEFAGSVQQMSDRVQAIDTDGHAIREIAQNGEGLVADAVSQMGTIEKSFGELQESVEKLGVQSREIGQITNIIRGIADQTNLLALNAAIEAARAGEQGRGFAVVADEVRSLAEQSGDATEQIAGLLREINTQVAEVMKETNESIEEVKAGSHRVQVAGETFREIGQAINKISARIQEVATYALELSSGSEEMAAATEEQAATLQGITTSANDLAEQASLLMKLTEGFLI